MPKVASVSALAQWWRREWGMEDEGWKMRDEGWRMERRGRRGGRRGLGWDIFDSLHLLPCGHCGWTCEEELASYHSSGWLGWRAWWSLAVEALTFAWCGQRAQRGGSQISLLSFASPTLPLVSEDKLERASASFHGEFKWRLCKETGEKEALAATGSTKLRFGGQ